MKNVYSGISTRETSQREAIPGRQQVQLASGGWGFELDDWVRLHRWLVTGSESGTYYIKPKKLTIENAECVIRCLREDGKRVVDEIVAISQAGRAPKNEPCVFALAVAAGMGDTDTKSYALQFLSSVCRYSTDLFHFCDYVQNFRGWGRSLRNAVSDWYNNKTFGSVAYQVTKYRQRDGWSHYDVLNLAHPKPATPEHNAIYGWIVAKHALAKSWIDQDKYDTRMVERLNTPELIYAFEEVQTETDKRKIILLIQEHNLTWEMIPTEFLNDPDVYGELFRRMPITATIRQLGKATSLGVLGPMSYLTGVVKDRLSDPEILRKGRVHPWAILNAMWIYSRGRGLLGSLEWNPVREIVDALDEAFYLTYGNVESCGKRIALCLDHSGSMNWKMITAAYDRSGRAIPGMKATQAAAAMALITANTEDQYMILAFNRDSWPIDISPRQRLDDVIRGLNIKGGTDYAAPIRYCMEQNIPIDLFAIYGDEESWAGKTHMCQATQEYREKMGIDTRMAIVSMAPTGTTLDDPLDSNTMSVVGFDTATPQLVADFGRGDL